MGSASLSNGPIRIGSFDTDQGGLSHEEARAMLRAVLNLLDRWQLSMPEKLVLLGASSEQMLQNWRKGEVRQLPVDTLHRVGHLLEIHMALRSMFADPDRAYAWIRRPNEAFGGRPALDVMKQGALSDIGRVRAYLDAERGDA